MSAEVEVTGKTINQLAWCSGFRGAAGLARHLGVHRVSVFRAAAGHPGLKRLRSRIVSTLARKGTAR